MKNITPLELHTINIEEIENSRKFHFYQISSIFALLMLTTFGILYYIGGNYKEFLICAILITTIILTYIFLRRAKNRLPIYRGGLGVLTITFLFATGEGIFQGNDLYLLFLVPMTLFFFLNKREGAIWSSIYFGVVCILIIWPDLLETYEYGLTLAPLFLSSLLFVIIGTYFFEASRSKYSDLFAEKHARLLIETEQLQIAIKEINALEGLLPICANCKKIRNEYGQWSNVEHYIQEHSNVEFSHGLCMDCAKKLYPHIDYSQKDGQG